MSDRAVDVVQDVGNIHAVGDCTPMVTATASGAYQAPCASLVTVPCSAVTARMARMPTGIHTASRCTIAEPRSRPSTAKGAARRVSVMPKTIARTVRRYEVLGTGGLLQRAAGGDGMAGQQQTPEQQQCGEHGRGRGDEQSDGGARPRQQQGRQLLAGAERVQRQLGEQPAQREFQALVAVADLPVYEAFLSRRVMAIPRIKNVTSHFTMKTVKHRP